MITAKLLTDAKLCTEGVAEKWAPALAAAAEKFEIDSPERVVGWLAQCAHESGHFKFVEENLNYSADALQKIFNKYFTPAQAAIYARQPKKIANRVYANRMGNGSEGSNDGYNYRGRGLIQLTGKANYTAYASAVGNVEILNNPDLVSTPEHAAMSAAWFWAHNGLNKIADAKDIEKMTKVINGGTIGLEDRKHIYAQLTQVLLA